MDEVGVYLNNHNLRTLTSFDTILILSERSCCTGIDWKVEGVTAIRKASSECTISKRT